MNVSNGGLIALLHGNLYVCDLSQYSGTRVLSEDGSTVWNADATMWFAAADDNGLYCSNQKDFDYLTYLDAGGMTERRVLKRPCENLIMSSGRVLLLDEEDGYIYEYDPVKDKCILVLKERVTSFILVSDTLYFAVEGWLKCFNMRSRRSEKLSGCSPVCLNYADNHLIFADKQRDYALCRFDIGQNKLETFDGIRTQSIITAGEYIFASNLDDSNSIVRIGAGGGAPIRFCGESTDKLHIIGEHLYFLNQNDNNAWYKVPLSGGRTVPLFPDK